MSDSFQIINGTPSLIISYWFYSITSPSYPSLHHSFFMVGILLTQIQPKSFKPWTGSSRFSEARPPFDGSGLRFRRRPTFAQQAREAGGMRVGWEWEWRFWGILELIDYLWWTCHVLVEPSAIWAAFLVPDFEHQIGMEIGQQSG